MTSEIMHVISMVQNMELERGQLETYRFELPEGPVIITLPRELSSEDIEDLKVWFELVLRMALRTAMRNNT